MVLDYLFKFKYFSCWKFSQIYSNICRVNPFVSNKYLKKQRKQRASTFFGPARANFGPLLAARTTSRDYSLRCERDPHTPPFSRGAWVNPRLKACIFWPSARNFFALVAARTISRD